MYDLIAIFKQALAGLGVAFGSSWAAIGALASALKVDVATGKQVVIAAVAAVIGFLAGGVGNWLKQLRAKIGG